MSARPLKSAIAALLLVVLAACGSNVPRLDDAPVNSYATPVGYKGIRYWGDAELKKLNEASAARLEELKAAHKVDPSIPLNNASQEGKKGRDGAHARTAGGG